MVWNDPTRHDIKPTMVWCKTVLSSISNNSSSSGSSRSSTRVDSPHSPIGSPRLTHSSPTHLGIPLT
eukprot:5239898-Prorocentrum_lima.AAC.1